MKLKKNDNDNILGNKLKPAMKLIEGLNREEFEQLIKGMRLLFDGVQEFYAVIIHESNDPVIVHEPNNPFALPIKPTEDYDIEQAEKALSEESAKKKAKKPKKKK